MYWYAERVKLALLRKNLSAKLLLIGHSVLAVSLQYFFCLVTCYILNNAGVSCFRSHNFSSFFLSFFLSVLPTSTPPLFPASFLRFFHSSSHIPFYCFISLVSVSSHIYLYFSFLVIPSLSPLISFFFFTYFVSKFFVFCFCNLLYFHSTVPSVVIYSFNPSTFPSPFAVMKFACYLCRKLPNVCYHSKIRITCIAINPYLGKGGHSSCHLDIPFDQAERALPNTVQCMSLFWSNTSQDFTSYPSVHDL